MNEYKTLSKHDLTLKETLNSQFNSSSQCFSPNKLHHPSKLEIRTSTQIILKELPENFFGRGEMKGSKFSKIADTYKGYLYEVERSGIKYYEVFKRKINVQYGVVKYPNSKAFGIWAWTYFSSEKAMKKFEEINKD